MRFSICICLLFFIQIGIAQDARFEVCPLKVGMEIPEVALVNQENKQVSLNSIAKEKPTILIFYRGAWCGYCTKHLAELNDAKADIEKLGYQILGITIDKVEKLAESKSEIPVYSDTNLEASAGFGLDWKVNDELFKKYKEKYNLDLEAWSGQEHHTLPVPAVFIIKDGVVQFQYVNPDHSKRLKVNTLLSILETL